MDMISHRQLVFQFINVNGDFHSFFGLVFTTNNTGLPNNGFYTHSWVSNFVNVKQ